MERRDWSLEALKRLTYVDSLDEEQRAEGLKSWTETYLTTTNITDFELSHEELLNLRELLFKNANFLFTHRENILEEMKNITTMKKFLKK
ncbi:hypothetical protein LXN10_05180 [Arcobacter sp. KX21116]|jgi:hypothetical protein|uniref:hypothetical protein n=1 Tax=Arcobacter iocasae TaxID=2906515 RepID=UPI0035D51FE2|tara:strand:- start:133604 stop:133873 length:270 start_codon:yes stop_codon:yes gene_type:complete